MYGLLLFAAFVLNERLCSRKKKKLPKQPSIFKCFSTLADSWRCVRLSNLHIKYVNIQYWCVARFAGRTAKPTLTISESTKGNRTTPPTEINSFFYFIFVFALSFTNAVFGRHNKLEAIKNVLLEHGQCARFFKAYYEIRTVRFYVCRHD